MFLQSVIEIDLLKYHKKMNLCRQWDSIVCITDLDLAFPDDIQEVYAINEIILGITQWINVCFWSECFLVF